ncbi:MAG: Spy/CpxP family protein refolding chaperone [Vicinamibacterales bacterium]
MIRHIRSRALLAGATLALVAGLGASIAAQGGGPGRRGGFGPGGPGRGGFPLGQLELSEAQREQVREVMQRHRDQMQEAGRRLREAHQAQRAAVEAVPLNEGLIRSTSQTLATAQTDMALLRARIHSDVWSLLTPEQQQKAKELREQRANRANERRQRRQRRQG